MGPAAMSQDSPGAGWLWLMTNVSPTFNGSENLIGFSPRFVTAWILDPTNLAPKIASHNLDPPSNPLRMLLRRMVRRR